LTPNFHRSKSITSKVNEQREYHEGITGGNKWSTVGVGMNGGQEESQNSRIAATSWTLNLLHHNASSRRS
jgi:hypothetical protein